MFEEDVPEPMYSKLLEKAQAYLLDRLHKECTGLDSVDYKQPLPKSKEAKKKTNNSVSKVKSLLTLLVRG